MENLAGILAFTRAAEVRSFTKAARVLGISASGVSKAISRLEDEYRVRLLNRNSRSVTLTAEGEVLFQRCRRIVLELGEAEQELTRSRDAPLGRLRVTLPLSVGRRQIARLLPWFAEEHPDVALDVSVTDRLVDMVGEGFDVAVRVGRPPESRLIARRLMSGTLMTCAAPAYLQRHGVPSVPEDLAGHRCARFVMPDTGLPKQWEFKRGGRRVSVAVPGNLTYDHAESLVEAALAGKTLIQISSYVTDAEISAGLLQPVLVQYQVETAPVCILYPKNRHLTPKVRAFVDFLTRHCRESQPGRAATAQRAAGNGHARSRKA